MSNNYVVIDPHKMKKAFVSSGLKMHELYKKSDVRPESIYRLIRLRTSVREDVAYSLADALRVRIREILVDVEQPEKPITINRDKIVEAIQKAGVDPNKLTKRLDAPSFLAGVMLNSMEIEPVLADQLARLLKTKLELLITEQLDE